ncbi:hypothetical protein HDU88_006161 [Geranomyces variabilis]|nr:hypothetical protein HDU88_006161 [Geranomyces variabilis]
MWNTITSQDGTAVDSTAGYDPVAAAAAYYGSNWGAYQYGATADYTEAPPGVDYQATEVDKPNVSLESEWATHSQQFAESGATEATTVVQEVSTVRAAEPETQSGAAIETTATNSLESQQGNASQYPDATTGYDYSAYAAGHYFDPNAAYNGMDGYQYGHGHHAYGQPDYYSASYAAAAAAPKEIRNPFEDLAKPKEDKTEQAKVWPQRRGPARKRIIMGLPKKADIARKTKSAAETTSVDSLVSDIKSADSPTVAEMANPLTTENSQREAKLVQLVQMAAQEKENVEESDNKSTVKEPAGLPIPLPMKLPSFAAPVQKVRISQAAESEDDDALSDSEQPKLSNVKGFQQRGDTAINAVRSSTMTSSEISSRSAAAEALVAAKNAAANIMQREGFDRRAPLTVHVTITLAFSNKISISIAASNSKEITDHPAPLVSPVIPPPYHLESESYEQYLESGAAPFERQADPPDTSELYDRQHRKSSSHSLYASRTERRETDYTGKWLSARGDRLIDDGYHREAREGSDYSSNNRRRSRDYKRRTRPVSPMGDSGTDDEEGFVARHAGKKAHDSSREYDDLDVPLLSPEIHQHREQQHRYTRGHRSLSVERRGYHGHSRGAPPPPPPPPPRDQRRSWR